MSVRRSAAWFVTALALLVGVVMLEASPAAAADDAAKIRLPGNFTAGGSAGEIRVTVTKRTEGCVSVRTRLSIGLLGLSADQVRAQVVVGGRWQPVNVSGGSDGLVVTALTAPSRAELCRRKSLSVRYQLTFLAGAPGGKAVVAAEAYTARGGLIAADTGTSTVRSRMGSSPLPKVSLSPSATASPSPTAEVEEEIVEVTPDPTETASAVALDSSVDKRGSDGGGFFTTGKLVMLFGVGLVGVGVALLVALVRR